MGGLKTSCPRAILHYGEKLVKTKCISRIEMCKNRTTRYAYSNIRDIKYIWMVCERNFSESMPLIKRYNIKPTSKFKQLEQPYLIASFTISKILCHDDIEKNAPLQRFRFSY